MSNPQFPLTLAEVLFTEIYGEPALYDNPSPQNQDSNGAKLSEKIKANRKTKKGKASLSDGWFDGDEQTNWDKRRKASDEIVPLIYQAIHDQANQNSSEQRAALCLSGGGIRSATFNLGVLQGLARNGFLGKFDYLSTVSGGGFIGSWLTAWIRRAGLQKAIGELGRQRPVNDQGESTPLEPEPKPVANLRVYANYLTPKKGLLSADTWTLLAVYLRNLMLNWLVFVPAIMAILMLPRIWAAMVNAAAWEDKIGAPPSPKVYFYFGLAGVAMGIISLAGILLNLPSVANRNWKRRRILTVVIFPLCLTAMLLCLYWMVIKREPALADLGAGVWRPFLNDAFAVWGGKRPSWPTFVIVGALLPAGPLLFLSLKQPKGNRSKLSERLLSVLLVLFAGALTGLFTYVTVHAEVLRYIARLCGVDYRFLYSSVAVPSVLVVLMIGGTLVAGFSSRFSTAEDQEWWARSGAWLLLVAAVWLVGCLAVMFGPLFLIDIRGLFSGQRIGTTKAVITTVVGVVSGALSLLGGSSSKTPVNGEVESNDLKARILSVGTSLAASIFALFLIILLVWMTDWLLLGLAQITNTPLPLDGAKSMDRVRLLPIWLQLLATGVLWVLSGIAGLMINTNRFSLHYYWRNRIVRAYLGASNPARDNQHDKATAANNFTEFAESDGVRMSEVAATGEKKLFHIINIALNLAGGEKLQWQDRKCESFTVSPLHTGSYWLGYRKSEEYARGMRKKVNPGDATGISLGTAVAISGAAASPNMGYMMTSPVVRFLMTLFNVRLGFWLGNPGIAGSGDPSKLKLSTFDRDSPAQSVRPIFAEAMGMTNANSPYVYLSDGGHFENFGLYEMVLRRCRYVVISDSSTDTNYDFESLAMAIRQIRVDFGVPIDMQKMTFGSKPDPNNDYCAIGTIRYSCVDKIDDAKDDSLYDGVLIYLKPSLLNNEPRDVLNYHRANPTFPEESIVDQWFSESQFESYRALGNHMIERVCQEKSDLAAGTLARFEKQAAAHVKRQLRP